MTRRHRPVALLALTLLGACARDAAPPSPDANARPVEVAPVAALPLGEQVHAVGVLGLKDAARLAFKVGGVIDAIRVEEGAPVRAGQLLALLKQTEVGAALDQARQAADKAARDLARGRALYADGVATEEQVQDLTTAERVAAAQLKAAEFNAAYARIVAPADGVVLRKLAEANELVQAGQPVLWVGDTRSGWIVRVGLADRDAVRIRIGSPAEVRLDAFPNQVFAGRVSNIASSADAATGTFTIEVQVQSGGVHFADGLVAKVALAPAGAAVGPALPVSALIEANGGDASVFVLDPATGVARRVAIRIGRLSDGHVEVLGGLAPRALVVVGGGAFLENGERVRVVGAAARAAG